MGVKMFDTCCLLDHIEDILKDNDKFYVSILSFYELENIKTSKRDEDIKYKARKVLRLLKENDDKYITVSSSALDKCVYSKDTISNDMGIIKDAARIGADFYTSDLSCYFLAKDLLGEFNDNNAYLYNEVKKSANSGFMTFMPNSDEELAHFYANHSEYIDLVKNNEYIIVKDKTTNDAIDAYKRKNGSLIQVPFKSVKSYAFGEIKPKDIYQRCAIDSILNNQVTVLGGKAGSGKSFLALASLFSMLEKGKIDKIVILCNPVAARGACKLGFYKGDVIEKLLSSQVGHVLSSKLGSRYEVERLINENKLDIIPVADARGYEVPENCGLYILEAQNLTSDLLRLILQRAGEDTKIIVDGDRFEQLDMDIYVSDNGMEKMCEVFSGEDIFGHIDLQYIYRSEVARIAERMK